MRYILLILGLLFISEVSMAQRHVYVGPRYYYSPRVYVAPAPRVYVAPVPRVYYPPARVTVIAGPHMVVPYAGISYTFGGGYWYRPYGGYFNMVFPPVGISIGYLPYGYSTFYMGPSMFFYLNGIYYMQNADRSYRVVDPPMGAVVNSLPHQARKVVVNGETFYELNGTYYRRDVNEKGKTVYTVVGKNGKINNTPAPSQPQEKQQTAPNIGDVYDKLPDGSKSVTVNGEAYFVAPDNTYYKEINDEQGKGYQVVEKPVEADPSLQREL
ncbi:DUF6515 family protein [Danxiaibacter flavus]|uniref:DUF6515 family protein n=1 Tax=Danxiaibacter flavus TaxID=3049108 RepID=A0ABV3ZEI5_9BACT|nr:DUF6515 family protein [Chitinophagaceae bacterium DXS]